MDLSRRGPSAVMAVSTEVEKTAFAMTVAASSEAVSLKPRHSANRSWVERLRAVLHANGGGSSTFIVRSILVPLVPYIVIGIVCGIVAYLYYVCLETLLHVLWKTIPLWLVQQHSDTSTESINLIWTIPVLVMLATSVMVGVIWYGGETMDLAATIGSIHTRGHVPWTIVPGMVGCSLASIAAGASLGPEAPLVSICASVAGAVSRSVLVPLWERDESSVCDDPNQVRESNVAMVRHHSVLGMSCATAAFFGCPLGGSLFALEVLSARFSHHSPHHHGSAPPILDSATIEYVQHHGLSAIATGTIALVVFRYLAQLPIEHIWDLTASTTYPIERLLPTSPQHVMAGAMLGCLGAAVACGYGWLRNHVKSFVQHVVDAVLAVTSSDPTPRQHFVRSVAIRAMLGAIGISTLGLFAPHTLFWGEFELQTIATLSPARMLPHLLGSYMLPLSAGYDFADTDHPWKLAGTAVCISLAKFLAIAISIAGGYRGGFIFPLFCAAAALGRAIHLVLVLLVPITVASSVNSNETIVTTLIPLQLCVLCLAAAVNVAVTRTAIATTLILTFLSGEPNALPALLVASLVSLYLTSFTPWVYLVTPPPAVAASVPSGGRGTDPKSVDSTMDDECSSFLIDIDSDEYHGAMDKSNPNPSGIC